jgi:hypothetical protein
MGTVSSFPHNGSNDNPVSHPDNPANPTINNNTINIPSTQTSVISFQKNFTNHQIYLRNSGYCLKTYKDKGSHVKLIDCVVHNGEDTYLDYINGQLTYTGSNYCIGVRQAETNEGAGVIMWSCDGGKEQQWIFRTDGKIQNWNSGLCIGFEENLDPYKKNKLHQYNCDGQNAARFAW